MHAYASHVLPSQMHKRLSAPQHPCRNGFVDHPLSLNALGHGVETIVEKKQGILGNHPLSRQSHLLQKFRIQLRFPIWWKDVIPCRVLPPEVSIVQMMMPTLIMKRPPIHFTHTGCISWNDVCTGRHLMMQIGSCRSSGCKLCTEGIRTPTSRIVQ